MARIYQLSLYALSIGIPLIIMGIPDIRLQAGLHIFITASALLVTLDTHENIMLPKKVWKLINNPFDNKRGLNDIYNCCTLSMVLSSTLVILNN